MNKCERKVLNEYMKMSSSKVKYDEEGGSDDEKEEEKRMEINM